MSVRPLTEERIHSLSYTEGKMALSIFFKESLVKWGKSVLIKNGLGTRKANFRDRKKHVNG